MVYMPLVIIFLFFFVDTFPVASGHCGVVLYEVVAKGRLTEGGARCGHLTISGLIVGIGG